MSIFSWVHLALASDLAHLATPNELLLWRDVLLPDPVLGIYCESWPPLRLPSDRFLRVAMNPVLTGLGYLAAFLIIAEAPAGHRAQQALAFLFKRPLLLHWGDIPFFRPLNRRLLWHIPVLPRLHLGLHW